LERVEERKHTKSKANKKYEEDISYLPSSKQKEIISSVSESFDLRSLPLVEAEFFLLNMESNVKVGICLRPLIRGEIEKGASAIVKKDGKSIVKKDGTTIDLSARYTLI
jgi:hypothetical protein